jgi:D-serine deaminase-like pyridoxal phosphate-dependent protein
MKNTRRFAVLAALAASAVAAQAAGFDFADNSSYPPEVRTQSTLTRAQVVNELKAAQANGSMPSVAEGYMPIRNTAASSVSRDQVRQEAAAAERAGQLDFGA